MGTYPSPTVRLPHKSAKMKFLPLQCFVARQTLTQSPCTLVVAC